MSTNTFIIPANSDYDAFLKGQLLADHKKKRSASMILAVIAGFLLYIGTKTTPIDEKLTYAGALTLVYIFVGRSLMFKMKFKALWKQKRETNPELIITKKGVEVKHRIPELCKTESWNDFGFYKIEEESIFLYPKKSPEKWLTLSLKELEYEKSQSLKLLVKEAITLLPQPIK